jgi:hypothetical protein
MSTFDDNSSQSPAPQTACIDSDAVVFGPKATLRIVAVNNCSPFVLVEAFLELIPNLRVD